MQLLDTSFEIKTILIFNPKLKPDIRKPIQQQIQQAKIVFYFPQSTLIQQKRNHVGLAQGLYTFFDSFCPEDSQQARHQIISTNKDIFIIKQCEKDIWLMIGINKIISCEYSKQKIEHMYKQIHTYDYQQFDEEVCLNIINHFYTSFKTFYGKIINMVSLKQRIPQFTKIMNEFISRYILLNQNQTTKKLDLNYYLFSGFRQTPLDQNYILKFNYFNSILQSIDVNVKDTLIFYNGYLIFTTLSPDITLLFFNYYYSLGQPFKFDEIKIKKKFTSLQSFKQLGKSKYGYFINSKNYGYDNKRDKKKIQKKNEDLLDLQSQNLLQLIQVHLNINNEEVSYRMNTFLEEKLLFITFSNAQKPIQKLYFQNKFFHDNVDRFNQKIVSILNPLNSQTEFYKFIYINLINLSGKITFTFNQIEEINVPLRMIFKKLSKNKQSFFLCTISTNWIYGLRRLNRILILLCPNNIGVHQIENYLDALSKDYFPLIYI